MIPSAVLDHHSLVRFISRSFTLCGAREVYEAVSSKSCLSSIDNHQIYSLLHLLPQHHRR